MKRNILFPLLVLALTSVNGFAQASLDKYFGNNGEVITDIGSVGSIGQSIAIQPDDKIIVGGYTSHDGLNYDFALVRYHANGILDHTFGIEGKVFTPVGRSADFGKAITLQADGKILLGGYSSNGNNSDFALVRYNSNGCLDFNFGENGKVVTDIGGFNDYGKSIAIQSNGKIVVTGESYNGNDYDFATIRYNSDGSLDNTFANNGIAITDINNDNNNAEALAIDFFGNILIVGYSVMDSNKDISIIRYNSNGVLDVGFNGSGKLCIDIDQVDNTANAIILQRDGNIIVTGYSNNAEYNAFAMLRIMKNGKLDYDFGDNGKVTASLEKDGIKGTSLALQSDGKILVGGYKHNGKDYDFTLMRFTEDGGIDDYFSDNGVITSEIQTSNDYCYAVNIQQDGKILLAGNSSNGSKESFVVTRYITTDDITSSAPY
jgi:uncharacterized delta-60 repeat protein